MIDLAWVNQNEMEPLHTALKLVRSDTKHIPGLGLDLGHGAGLRPLAVRGYSGGNGFEVGVDDMGRLFQALACRAV